MQQDRDDRLYQQWISQLPIMAVSGNVMTFDDYRKRVTGGDIDTRPTPEILAEVEEAERQLKEA